VKTGTEKLFTTINRGQPEEQNKKRIQEIQDKLLDSSGKVTCLTKALQRYQGLYIGNENDIDIEKVEEEEHNGKFIYINIIINNIYIYIYIFFFFFFFFFFLLILFLFF